MKEFVNNCAADTKILNKYRRIISLLYGFLSHLQKNINDTISWFESACVDDEHDSNTKNDIDVKFLARISLSVIYIKSNPIHVNLLILV